MNYETGSELLLIKFLLKMNYETGRSLIFKFFIYFYFFLWCVGGIILWCVGGNIYGAWEVIFYNAWVVILMCVGGDIYGAWVVFLQPRPFAVCHVFSDDLS